jgi:mitochondrial fission protein ELM1
MVPASLVARLWDIPLHKLEPPDLIVSSGADTLAPNVRLSRHFNCRNVFIGSVRRLASGLFTAVLTARPDLSGRDRHHLVLSPSPIDPDQLRAPRPIESRAALSERTVALLVGGPTSDCRFAEADWEALHRLVAGTAEAGTRWDITSSRRTPHQVADGLARLAASVGGDKVTFVDYRYQSSGSIDPLFNADAVLVTEDSNTMLSEAVAARRPALALRPERMKAVAPSVAPLLERKLIGSVPMREVTSDRVVEAIADLHPLVENPLDTLYRVLEEAGALPQSY